MFIGRNCLVTISSEFAVILNSVAICSLVLSSIVICSILWIVIVCELFILGALIAIEFISLLICSCCPIASTMYSLIPIYSTSNRLPNLPPVISISNLICLLKTFFIFTITRSYLIMLSFMSIFSDIYDTVISIIYSFMIFSIDIVINLSSRISL